jgi:hypothetical protein
LSKKDKVSKQDTVTFSSRIYKDIFTIIEKEAKSKNISTNSLINNILGKYTTLERFANDIELISLTKRSIIQIFSRMEENTIKQIAKDVGGVVHRELVFLKFDEMSFDNLMHVLVVNASRYGTVKHNEENLKHHICIHHGSCIEFSQFLAQVHKNMAHHLSVKIDITNTDQNMVCMKIQDPEDLK